MNLVFLTALRTLDIDFLGSNAFGAKFWPFSERNLEA